MVFSQKNKLELTGDIMVNQTLDLLCDVEDVDAKQLGKALVCVKKF